MEQQLFIRHCENGDLDGIKQIIKTYKINIYTYDTDLDNEFGFAYACYKGHLHIIEYLVNLYKINPDYNIINIHADDERGFILACDNGHLHIVKYLINLYKINSDYDIINIYAKNEEGFIWTHTNGLFQIVKYLINLGCYIHHYNNIILL